jgi:hypothetical protein
VPSELPQYRFTAVWLKEPTKHIVIPAVPRLTVAVTFKHALGNVSGNDTDLEAFTAAFPH